jgi:hypothetical protein
MKKSPIDSSFTAAGAGAGAGINQDGHHHYHHNMAPAARPPAFPRPSSAVAKSRLKDRLVLSAGKGRPITNSPPLKKDGAGIGERQFDRFDDEDDIAVEDLHHSPVTFGGDESSVLTQQNLNLTTHNIANRAIKHNTSSLVHGNEYNAMRQGLAPDSASLMSRPYQQQPQQTPFRPDSSSIQHTTVAQNITGNPKWDRLATSLADGSTEFCYMEELPDNSYKFSFSSHPASNNFSTLSRFGILRMLNGEGEKIPFDHFLFEHHLHAKLTKIKVFGQFRLWKTLYCWRHTVRERKCYRAVCLFGCCATILSQCFIGFIFYCRHWH